MKSEKLSSQDYEEIYIHAKVAIVDDAAFTIGSTNINLRSMALDSELNILSNASEIAYKLRTDLFSQCAGFAGPPKFEGMGKAFKDWKSTQTENSALKARGEKLHCHALPFRVERKPSSSVI